MSERPWESIPPDKSTTSAAAESLEHQQQQQQQRQRHQQQQPHNPNAPVQPEQQYGRPPSSAIMPGAARQSTGSSRAMELPPLRQQPSSSGGSFPSASRSAGVSSILNPTEPEAATGSRRRKASDLISPRSSSATLPPLAAGQQSAWANNETRTSGSYASTLGDRPPRRILTPRSPSLHRAASLNQLNPPSATISTQYAPFAVSPHSRAYTIEPGTSGAPPLPTPPAAVRQNYGFSTSTPPLQAARRASTSASRVMRPTSESTSPRSSYSSYSQAEQASPATQPALPSMSAPYAAHHDPSMSGPGTPIMPPSAGPDRQRAIGVPISSSGGQNVYQMMTLETTSGTVQLPVDVQAASRVADEKRRRNAGASARFRQRRKEKEKEASTTISRLEQQAKELGEDMEFYKRERDYLAGVVLQVPGGERHFPRPQSPRHRRTSGLTASSALSGSGYASLQEQAMGSPEEGRNVRQRTNTLSLPPPPPPQSSVTGLQSGYAPQTYGQPLAPQPPPPLHQAAGPLPSPLARPSAPGQSAPGPPQLMQASPQTGPWNPYADRRPPGGPSQNRDSR